MHQTSQTIHFGVEEVSERDARTWLPQWLAALTKSVEHDSVSVEMRAARAKVVEAPSWDLASSSFGSSSGEAELAMAAKRELADMPKWSDLRVVPALKHRNWLKTPCNLSRCTMAY